jgi:hypothetical protein
MRLAALSAVFLSPIVALCLPLAWKGLGACITSTREAVNNLSGYDILVTETNCDSIAKTDSVSVSISQPGASVRDLIFEYDPVDGSSPPSFALDGGILFISTPAVSEVFHQQREWRDVSIRYQIGKIAFPISRDAIRSPQ